MIKKILISISVICIFPIILSFLYVNGYLRFNYPKMSHYPIHGLDVSHHQGKIEWNKIREESFHFAYIKATEGGNYKDPEFIKNWNEASNAGLLRGAYHFFTFGKPGIEQARNFIGTVPVDPDSLPPVIDFEFVGNSKKGPVKALILKELFVFIREIEAAYGKTPVIYITYDSYNKYLKGEIGKYKVWIRDIFFTPNMPDGISWTFWQYANNGRVKGINGPVDLNVFYKKDFSAL